MVKEKDARAVLNGERIDYWLGVGASPSDNVNVLIKKYGTNGTHLEQQQQALERLKTSKPTAPPPMAVPKKEEPKAAESPEEATVGQETPAAEDTATGQSNE
jgi:small subunit ribosomal protein S16